MRFIDDKYMNRVIVYINHTQFISTITEIFNLCMTDKHVAH